MLHEQERISDGTGFAGGDDFGLDAEAFGIRDAAGLEEAEEHDGS